MREEISAAVLFLTRLIEKGENCNHEQIELFKLCLSESLVEKFKNHWFPDTPYKGQGYRCIRLNSNSRKDPNLEEAAIASGIKYEDMKLPCELTIWVDPNEVCCRFGEHKGSFCTLASFSEKELSFARDEGQNQEAMTNSESSPSVLRNHSSSKNVSCVKGVKGGSDPKRSPSNAGSHHQNFSQSFKPNHHLSPSSSRLWYNQMASSGGQHFHWSPHPGQYQQHILRPAPPHSLPHQRRTAILSENIRGIVTVNNVKVYEENPEWDGFERNQELQDICDLLSY